MTSYNSYYKHIHRKTPCELVDNTVKQYQCEICNLEFDNYKVYWTHINRKTSCLSQDKCKEIVNKIEYYQEKTELQKQTLEEKDCEIQKLKQIVERLSEKDDWLKENQKLVQDKIDVIQESIQESKAEFNSLKRKQLSSNFTPDQINSMKESAYEGREFPKALWNLLRIKVEKTEVGGKNTGLKRLE